MGADLGEAVEDRIGIEKRRRLKSNLQVRGKGGCREVSGRGDMAD
jgi:hypothetical protein